MMFLAILLGSVSFMLLLTATCCDITYDERPMNDLLLVYSAVGALITVLITSYVDFELGIYLGILYLIIYTLILGYYLLSFIGRILK